MPWYVEDAGVGQQIQELPAVVKRAIKHTEETVNNVFETILLTVLLDKNCSETLESLYEGGGWDYIRILYNAIMSRRSVEQAWNQHQESLNK